MLTSLVAIMIGGGIGSALRWGISQRLDAFFPLLPPGTLISNIIAGFIIGFATVFFTRLTSFSPAVKLMITTGLCGGLSTFSTFSDRKSTFAKRRLYLGQYRNCRSCTVFLARRLYRLLSCVVYCLLVSINRKLS